MPTEAGYPTAAEALDLFNQAERERAAANGAIEDMESSGEPIPYPDLRRHNTRALVLYAAAGAAANLALLGPVNDRRRNPDPSIPR